MKTLCGVGFVVLCSSMHCGAPSEQVVAPESVVASVPASVQSGAVMTIRHLSDRVLAFSLSGTVVNEAGVLVRVASVSSLWDDENVPSGELAPTQSVCQVDIRHGFEVSGGGALIRPSEGRTWLDVRSDADLEFEVQ